jgi:hypothetical protein
VQVVVYGIEVCKDVVDVGVRGVIDQEEVVYVPDVIDDFVFLSIRKTAHNPPPEAFTRPQVDTQEYCIHHTRRDKKPTNP